MSRRRASSSPPTGSARLLFVCTGGSRPHAEYRIARCLAWVQPFTPGLVRVDYVHQLDADFAAKDRFRVRGVEPGVNVSTLDPEVAADLHFTWQMRCAKCRRDTSLTAEHLSDLIRRMSLLGVSRLDLVELGR